MVRRSSAFASAGDAALCFCDDFDVARAGRAVSVHRQLCLAGGVSDDILLASDSDTSRCQ